MSIKLPSDDRSYFINYRGYPSAFMEPCISSLTSQLHTIAMALPYLDSLDSTTLSERGAAITSILAAWAEMGQILKVADAKAEADGLAEREMKRDMERAEEYWEMARKWHEGMEAWVEELREILEVDGEIERTEMKVREKMGQVMGVEEMSDGPYYKQQMGLGQDMDEEQVAGPYYSHRIDVDATLTRQPNRGSSPPSPGLPFPDMAMDVDTTFDAVDLSTFGDDAPDFVSSQRQTGSDMNSYGQQLHSDYGTMNPASSSTGGVGHNNNFIMHADPDANIFPGFLHPRNPSTPPRQMTPNFDSPSSFPRMPFSLRLPQPHSQGLHTRSQAQFHPQTRPHTQSHPQTQSQTQSLTQSQYQPPLSNSPLPLPQTSPAENIPATYTPPRRANPVLKFPTAEDIEPLMVEAEMKTEEERLRKEREMRPEDYPGYGMQLLPRRKVKRKSMKGRY